MTAPLSDAGSGHGVRAYIPKSEPLPLPSDANNGKNVNKLKATGADSGPGPKQKAEEDAKWWLEPAGYARWPADKPVGKGWIGVLDMTENLVGVTTAEGDQYWISRFDNPIVFTRAKMALDDFNALYADVSNPVEKRFLAAAYKRYKHDFEPHPLGFKGAVLPEDIKHAIVQDEFAAFIAFDRAYGDERRFFMHKDDDPELWAYVAQTPDLRRSGLDPADEFVIPGSYIE